MSSDGCQPLPKGQPGAKSESYRDLRVPPPKANGHSAEHDGPALKSRQAATGTWDGPAPKENVNVRVASQVAQEKPFDPAKEPRTILLNNKMKLPLIGAHVTDGETVKRAISASIRWLDMPHDADFAGVGAALKEEPEGVKRDLLFITAALPPHVKPDGIPAAAAAIETGLASGPVDLLLLDCTGEPEEAEQLANAWQALLELAASDEPGSPLGLGVANAGVGVLDWLLLGAGAVGVQPAINRVPELNPMAARRKMCGLCRRKGGVAPVALAALGGPGGAKEALRENGCVVGIGEATGKPAEAVLVRYAIQRGTPVLLDKAELEHAAAAEQAFEFRRALPPFSNWSRTTADGGDRDSADDGGGSALTVALVARLRRLDYNQKVLMDTLPQGALALLVLIADAP